VANIVLVLIFLSCY